jgi:hypothetical protein
MSVRTPHTHDEKLGVEFGSKLITIPEEDKVVKLQCAFCSSHRSEITPPLAPQPLINTLPLS